MSSGGEIIHISLGPSANATTSHLLNLQGLSCTTSTSSEDEYAKGGTTSSSIPLCDPYVTHDVQDGTFVPRVLFVDGKDGFARGSGGVAGRQQRRGVGGGGVEGLGEGGEGTDGNQNVGSTSLTAALKPQLVSSQQQSSLTSYPAGHRMIEAPWDGPIEELHYSYDDDRLPPDSRAAAQSSPPLDPLAQFHDAASVLVNSSYSRYSSHNAPSTRHVYHPSSSSSNSNQRHMQWDSDEEEEDEEEEDEESKVRRQRMQHLQHVRQSQHIQEEMNIAWDNAYEQYDNGINFNWMDYWMGPYPSVKSYMVPLPFSTTSSSSSAPTDGSFLSSFHAGYKGTFDGMDGSFSTTWREDVLTNKLRQCMERCDTVKGFHCVTEDNGLYSGLTSGLLEECHDECRSAGRFTTLMLMDDDAPKHDEEEGEGKENEASGTRRKNEREFQSVYRFRSNLNSGLTLHGLASNSDLLLPVSLRKCNDVVVSNANNTSIMRSLFHGSAVVALGLESSTLPYRLFFDSSTSSVGANPRRRSKIGIQSGYFQGSSSSSYEDDSYATATKLSFHEYIACLKPSSSRHCMVEMDVRLAPFDDDPMGLYRTVLEGTSVDRKRKEEERMRNRSRGGSRYYRSVGPGREVHPGLWLNNAATSGSSVNGGILSSLSPSDTTTLREHHRHHALSTTIRPPPSTNDAMISSDPISAYTTPVMESMGIRYRPEVSLGTIVHQSFDMLTSNGYGAAGSYWKKILPPKNNIPVVAVMGNTTRIYPHLQTVSSGMKESLLSWKNKGYLSRDNMMGLAPEGEDCSEALEFGLDLRDSYEPPGGGGNEEEEGIYFDGNLD